MISIFKNLINSKKNKNFVLRFWKEEKSVFFFFLIVKMKKRREGGRNGSEKFSAQTVSGAQAGTVCLPYYLSTSWTGIQRKAPSAASHKNFHVLASLTFDQSLKKFGLQP